MQDLLAILKQELSASCGVVPGQRLVVGVSGGCDSVALLLLLLALRPQLRLELTVAHLDHGLRENSAEDADFVDALCDRLGVACMRERADVATAAKAPGVSVEMAARDARYGFFSSCVARLDAFGVAVAHTADDQAETLLLNLVRGCGLRGLGGMAACSVRDDGLRVLRPLLGVRRARLEYALRAMGESWREDPSNASGVHARNRLRHEVVAALNEINPAAVDNLAATAARVHTEDALLDTLAADVLEEARRETGGLDLHALRSAQPVLARRALRLWVAEHDFGAPSAEMTERLLVLGEGTAEARSLSLGHGHLVECAYGCLRVVAPASLAEWGHDVALPGRTLLPEVHVCLDADIVPGLVRDELHHVGQIPARASLCFRAGMALQVRTWRPGDVMAPYGMDGTRKVQDIFSDARVPRSQRHSIPLITVDDQIVWIPGYRVARGWQVEDPAAAAVHLALVSRESMD